MAPPTTKAELRARICGMYDALDAALALLSPTQMVTPDVNGAWSAKDTVAHLTYWDRSRIAYLDFALHGGRPNPSGTGGDDEIWNDRCFTAHRTCTLDDVLAEMYRTRRAILDRVDALAEDALLDPGAFAWLGGTALWELVDETEGGHYPEHIAQIEAWAARHVAAPTTQAAVLWLVADWHAALHSLVDAVPPGLLRVPGANADWSIKDEVAHLGYWLDTTVARLDGAIRDITPSVTNLSEAEIDRRNAECLAMSHARSTHDALAEYDAAYARLVVAILAVPEDALFDGARFAWAEGTPLVGYVAGNTWEHYPEHMAQIRRWLAMAGGA